MSWEYVCAARDCDAWAVTSLNDVPFCAEHVPITKPMRQDHGDDEPWLEYTLEVARGMRRRGEIDLSDADIEAAYAELQNRAARE